MKTVCPCLHLFYIYIFFKEIDKRSSNTLSLLCCKFLLYNMSNSHDSFLLLPPKSNVDAGPSRPEGISFVEPFQSPSPAWRHGLCFHRVYILQRQGRHLVLQQRGGWASGFVSSAFSFSCYLGFHLLKLVFQVFRCFIKMLFVMNLFDVTRQHAHFELFLN